ncbi:efflux RND transporter periplasmic adaptor subunit [Desulfovibrio sp. OttesenSCG-928-A18]|nr:efflux RND transporter periplasmic adaptor subunit [Desulfovibrio sp. OttesenSCG-928-A18]
MFQNSISLPRRAVVVLLATVFAALFLSACDDKQQQQQQPITTVTYMEIKTQSLTLTSELSGRTSAFLVSEVRPQVGGIIKERLFVEGSSVQQGDVLYQIEPDRYQAAFDSARATLEKAEANAVAARLYAERLEKVVKVNAVSKQDYDNAFAAFGQAQAEVSAARAALETARINLDYTKITAPISGRIDRSSVTPGALVTQNQATALATVQQLDPMYVDLTQSSSDLLRLKRAFGSGELRSSGESAMQATLRLEDGTRYLQAVPKKDPVTGEALKDAEGKPLKELVDVVGTLKFSEVTVEQSTGVVTIRALFPNPDGVLMPGMYVRAILEEGVNERAILIPRKAVIRNNRGEPVVQVLVKDDKNKDLPDVYTLEARVISVDRTVGNDWLVNGGLKPGEKIMLEGYMRVRPGAQVKGEPEPVNPGASTGTQSPKEDGGNSRPSGQGAAKSEQGAPAGSGTEK